MPLTKIGTCAWCGKHDIRLVYTATVVDGRLYGDYVCEGCREAVRLGETLKEESKCPRR